MSKITVFNKASLDISKFLDKDRRYMGLHVTNDYTEATDGHIAIRVEAVKQDSEDMPECPDGPSQAPIKEPFDLVINKDNTTKLLKNLPKNPTFPIIDRKTWIHHNNENTVGFSSTDLDSWTLLIVRKEDTKFPNISAAVPDEGKQVFEIALDSNLLSRLAGYYASHCKKAIKLIFHANGDGKPDPNGIIMLQGKTEDEQKVSSLLMPMEIKSCDPIANKFYGKKEPKEKK